MVDKFLRPWNKIQQHRAGCKSKLEYTQLNKVKNIRKTKPKRNKLRENIGKIIGQNSKTILLGNLHRLFLNNLRSWKQN